MKRRRGGASLRRACLWFDRPVCWRQAFVMSGTLLLQHRLQPIVEALVIVEGHGRPEMVHQVPMENQEDYQNMHVNTVPITIPGVL